MIAGRWWVLRERRLVGMFAFSLTAVASVIAFAAEQGGTGRVGCEFSA